MITSVIPISNKQELRSTKCVKGHSCTATREGRVVPSLGQPPMGSWLLI